MLPKPKVYSFSESNDINLNHLQFFGFGLNRVEKDKASNQIKALLDAFKDAREYGSILRIDDYDWDLLRRFIASDEIVGQISFDTVGLDDTRKSLSDIVCLGELMAQKYDSLVTNPPYMGITNGSGKLVDYVKKYYPDNKIDLFSVFMEKAIDFIKIGGYCSLITQQTWMFISSFLKTSMTFFN